MPESAFEDLARGALLEITPAENVGAYFDQVDEGDGVVSVLFDSAMPGYPDWKWTVSVASVEGQEPTVLEAELMPAEGALLSPDWVPWSDRLAEYKAAQDAADGASTDDDTDEPDTDDDELDDDELDDDSDDDDDESDDVDDDDDDDESDDDDDEPIVRVLHGGDLDGVDIDSLDEPDPELDESDDDESDIEESDEESDDEDDDEQDKSY